MRIPGTVSRCFEDYYQSRASIAAAAGFMTAVSSRVLLGSIDWRAVLVTTLCTAAAYWLDDCVDFKHHPSHLRPHVRSVKVLASICAIGVIFVFTHAKPFKFISLILLLGTMTAGFCFASSRISESAQISKPWLVLRTACISLVWSLAVVLFPIFDKKAPINFQVVASVGFTWILMFVVSAMWTEGEHPDRHLNHYAVASNWLLLAACVIAAVLVIFGVYLGYFPWMNLALLPACIFNALFLSFRQRFKQTDRRVINEAMILMNIFACLFVLGAYAHSTGSHGPHSRKDWFQLAVCAVFFGNIWIKSRTLKVRDDNGDYLDALALLGLALFGFQIMVSSLHIEDWLFPPLHWQLFDSHMASITGALLTIVALALQASAYIAMSTSWRLMANAGEPGELVTSGPFALTRNPIYLSVELYMAGAFLINGTIVFALLLFLSPIIVHIQICREEAFLARHYLTSYTLYSGKTPRYFFL
jgi:protein-S-isoprenylcysteine O-methyltransferase Ste14